MEHCLDDLSREQMTADAELGALVRRMPKWWSLLRRGDQWAVLNDADRSVAINDTPEAALRAALGDTPTTQENGHERT